MNICFLSGWITDVYKFKFIYNSKINHKCIITAKFELEDGQVIELITFDEMIDEVISNKFKFVHIYAKFVEKCRIQIIDIFGDTYQNYQRNLG